MSTPFITGELVEALKSMKAGKALGPDDTHPEFIHFTCRRCCNQVAVSVLCLPIWKDVKSPKSGARQLPSPSRSLTSPRTTLRVTGPSHCCASHSSCLKWWSMDVSTPSSIPCYLTSKLISANNRRPGYSANAGHCCFEAKETAGMAGPVLVDLTVACDTVWHRGLTLKLLHRHMVHFIVELISNRSFVLKTSDGQQSRLRRLKNGVPRNLSWLHCCSISTSMTSLIPSTKIMALPIIWPF